MGGLTTSVLFALGVVLLGFQSPQSGHGRFNEDLSKNILEQKTPVSIPSIGAKSRRSRGMGGLTRPGSNSSSDGNYKFQSPQSGHGRFNLQAKHRDMINQLEGFNPLNRGMGGLTGILRW